MTPTAYIVTPSTTNPDQEGYYCLVVQSRYHTAYWTGKEWRYYKNVPEKFAPQFESWLRPVDLSRLLEEAFEMSSLAFTKNMQYANGVATFNEQGFQADKAAYINSVLNTPK